MSFKLNKEIGFLALIGILLSSIGLVLNYRENSYKKSVQDTLNLPNFIFETETIETELGEQLNLIVKNIGSKRISNVVIDTFPILKFCWSDLSLFSRTLF